MNEEPQASTSAGDLNGAIVATVGLWVGLSLTRDAAIDALITALETPDAHAAISARSWLLISADPMPPAMLVGQLLRVMSESATLQSVS